MSQGGWKMYQVFGMIDLFSWTMCMYFLKCLQAVAVGTLRAYQIPSNLKEKLGLNTFSTVGLVVFFIHHRVIWGGVDMNQWGWQSYFSLFIEKGKLSWKTLTWIGNNSSRCSICRLDIHASLFRSAANTAHKIEVQEGIKKWRWERLTFFPPSF